MAARGLPFDLLRPPTDFRCRESALADRIARARLRGALFEAARGAAIAMLPALRSNWSVVRRVNRALIEIVLELQSAQVFVDGSKDPVRFKHLRDTRDYRMRLIHLVRDARAVVHSAGKNQSIPLGAAARDWRLTHEQIERLASDLPERSYLRIRYEDLCAEPLRVMREVFVCAGVDPELAPPDFALRAHHVLGNRMRLNFSSEIRVDERWRAALSPAQVRRVLQLAGAKNAEYGYS